MNALSSLDTKSNLIHTFADKATNNYSFSKKLTSRSKEIQPAQLFPLFPFFLAFPSTFHTTPQPFYAPFLAL